MWRDILYTHTYITGIIQHIIILVCFNKQYSTKFFKINILNDYLMLYGLYIL